LEESVARREARKRNRKTANTAHAHYVFTRTLQHNPLQILFIGIDVTNEADLKRAKEEAERTAKEKSTFLASISHEIRTPLHCIVGYMQLLQVWLVQPPMQSG
jgi:signal transduction histidine kinase